MSLRAALPVWLGLMVFANVAFNRWSAGSVVLGLAVVGGMAVLAWWSGLDTSDLGLARRTWPAGLRWGGVCVAVAACGYGVALLIPAARGAVDGSTGSWRRMPPRASRAHGRSMNSPPHSNGRGAS